MRPFRSGPTRLAIGLLAGVAAVAANHRLVSAEADTVPAGIDLYLLVYIDGVSTGLIAAFRSNGGGSFVIDPDQLRNVGLAVDPGAIGPEGLVAVDRLPGVSYRYDAPSQSMFFDVDLSAREPQVIDAGAGGGEAPAAETAFGAVLNYRISVGTRYTPGESLAPHAGVSLEPRVFGNWGTVASTFTFTIDTDGPSEFSRGTTSWFWSSTEHLVTLRAGDIVTSGLSWTQPVRLGGFQVSRNFDLRPDLVTFPIPTLAGTAAVPSTIDVYVNNAKAYSGGVAPGAFAITNLPAISGAGTMSLVLSDALGNETITELPYFATPQLLRDGLLDFSIEGGFPRIGFGTSESSYVAVPMMSATARFGWSDSVTLEGHVEGGRGLANAGVGAVVGLGRFGVVSLNAGVSRSEAGVGYQVGGALHLEAGPLHFTGSLLAASPTYANIASVTAHCTSTPDCAAPAPLAASALLSVGLGRSSLGISYDYLRESGGDITSRVGISASARVGSGASFRMAGYTDLAGPPDFGVFASLSMPIGDLRGGTSIDRDDGDLAIRTTVSKPYGAGHAESTSWSFAVTTGPDPKQVFRAAYAPSFADLDLRVTHDGGEIGAHASISGAVVTMGGGLFVVPPIHDAFAVVDVGAAGVPVLYENRPAGETGARGFALLTDLRSHEENRIAIDPTGLPIDMSVGQTAMTVTPRELAGVVVRFDVTDGSGSAVLVLTRGDGDFVPPGSEVVLAATGAAFVVGYDGIAFLTGLATSNAISVSLPDGSICEAEFALDPVPGIQSVVPLMCAAL